MDVALLVNTLMVFFAWLQSVKVLKYGLFVSFFILFVFLAFRYEYGNDYHDYLKNFILFNKYSNIEYFSRDYHYEAGWIFLCRVFKPVGFFGMVAFLALFNCLVYYRFIRKYVPVAYYWLAVFIYVFSPEMMLTHSSAMRQSITISLFILAIDFIIKRRIIPYLLLIGLAWLFHTSALILLPIYFVTYLHTPLKLYVQIAMLGLFVFLFFYGQIFAPIINDFIVRNFERYEVYDAGGQLGTGLGFVVLLFFFGLTLFFDQHQGRAESIPFKLSVISYLLLPLGLILLMLSRVGMYFQVVNIAVFPLIFTSFHKSIGKYLSVLAVVSFTLYNFYIFFHSEVWRESFGVYKTIFSAPFLY